MEQKVKLVVEASGCSCYQIGDEIIFDGPLLDKEKSGKLCMMALNALFPFVYAARKGVVTDHPLQCPDCAEKVTFRIQKV